MRKMTSRLALLGLWEHLPWRLNTCLHQLWRSPLVLPSGLCISDTTLLVPPLISDPPVVCLGYSWAKFVQIAVGRQVPNGGYGNREPYRVQYGDFCDSPHGFHHSDFLHRLLRPRLVWDSGASIRYRLLRSVSIVFPQVWDCRSGSALYAPKGHAIHLGGGGEGGSDVVVRRLASWAWDRLEFASNTFLLLLQQVRWLCGARFLVRFELEVGFRS